MTITELQRELQIIYERYGDVEVVMEDTDWTGVEIFHDEISVVKNVAYNGRSAVALANH
nr:MAG TPA: hypothetical protein [Caudoviricetes sp.]